jgi:hypothetical protein
MWASLLAYGSRAGRQPVSGGPIGAIQVHVLMHLGAAQAKAGDFKGALKIAEMLKDSDWWKLNILQVTANLQAQRGEARAVREWIGALDSPLARAYALMGAAEGIVTATRPLTPDTSPRRRP